MTPHTVFVTGATSGIGEAVARRFVAEGHKVLLTGRRADRLMALADELGERAHARPLDVRSRQDVSTLADNLPEGWADVSILVNNAGLALGLGPAHEASLDDWQAMIDTNVTGLVSVTRALLPGMVARGRGHVVNLGSVAASYPYPGGNVYAATKGFVRQLSLALRSDLLGTPVRVTCVEPGAVETEFSVVRFAGDTDRASQVYQGYRPLGAEDVAEAVFWCATLPAHVNVNVLELMPTAQAFGPFAFARQ